MLVLKNPIEM